MLQPIDTCVNKIIKNKFRKEYFKYLAENHKEKIDRVDMAIVQTWEFLVLNYKESIARSFLRCGIS